MRAAGAPKGTVIIASSMSGNNAPLAKALAIAGGYGLTRIVDDAAGLAGRARGRHLARARHSRGTRHPAGRPPARYAFLAMTDVLAQTVATRMQAPAVAAMRRIKHQLVVNRDGDDTPALGD